MFIGYFWVVRKFCKMIVVFILFMRFLFCLVFFFILFCVIIVEVILDVKCLFMRWMVIWGKMVWRWWNSSWIFFVMCEFLLLSCLGLLMIIFEIFFFIISVFNFWLSVLLLMVLSLKVKMVDLLDRVSLVCFNLKLMVSILGME